MSFGESLKRVRLEKGYTQESLANKIGVKKQTISRYENSQREPNFFTAIKIANSLEVPIEYLIPQDELEKILDDDDNDEDLDPAIFDLLMALEDSPPPVRNAAIAAALAVLKSDLTQK